MDIELKSEIEKLKSKGNVKQKYDCILNKEVIRNYENLRNDTKMMSMKMENMSSKKGNNKEKM